MFGKIAFKKKLTIFYNVWDLFHYAPASEYLSIISSAFNDKLYKIVFLMAIIAPSILVAMFHWVPMSGGIPRSTKFAAYIIGGLMGIIFFLLDSIAISGSGVSSSWKIVNVYDLI
jgi:hypothetical protein